MITRRRFAALMTTLVGAGGAGISWCARPNVGRCELSGRAFGTTVNLTVLHDDDAAARKAAAAAMQEMLRVESLLSLHRPDGAVVRLNQRGRLDAPPTELVEVLRAAAEISCRSLGAFDVTVQPLWELHEEARRRGRDVTVDEEAAAMARVDWRNVRVSDACVELIRADVRITLNGIAQGYVTDRVRSVLRAHGVCQALLDTGEIGSLGGKSSAEPWQVGIQHPRDPDAYIALARLQERCLATSGDYSTPFTDDLTRHHVFDPRTGRSPRELASVSVVAPSALDADALSTAVMVLGVEQGRRLIEEYAGADALFVTKEGQVLATSGFPLA